MHENNQNEEKENIDIKISKGLEQIQKLDKLLIEKCAYEKEVKRERKRFEKELQSEIRLLDNAKGTVYRSKVHLKSVCSNSNSQENNSNSCSENNNAYITPIFHTQIGEKYYDSSEPNFQNIFEHKAELFTIQPNKSSKDFIKRNVELASRAKCTIALTEGEEKRLFELLNEDNDSLLDNNPFLISTQSVIGDEQVTENDRRKLDDIDEKLKEFLSNEEYVLLNEEVPISFNFLPDDSNGCGEHVLQEKHDERTLKQKIKDIDDKLLDLKNDDNSLIDPDILRRLLDNNLRLTSACTSICESVCSNDNQEFQKY